MKYVLTGGPSTGKTTLIKQLRDYGYSIVPEVPRQIIAEEQAKESSNYKTILPWTDLAKFNELLIKRQIGLEAKVDSGLVFLDRGLVDPLAYLRIGRLPVPENLYSQIKEANYSKVFFLEQLNLYVQDDERKESEEQGLALHHTLFEVYDELNFEIIRVPALDKKRRLEFVLDAI